MKNCFLHVSRVLTPSGNAPEYASSALAIDVTLTGEINCTADLTLRIFSKCFAAISADTQKTHAGKKQRRLHFEVSDAHDWQLDRYTVVVYCDNEPFAECSLNLKEAATTGKRYKLTMLQSTDVTYFIARYLWNDPLWERINNLGLEEDCIGYTLSAMADVARKRKQKDYNSIHPLLIMGDAGKAADVAVNVIGRFFGGGGEANCYRIKLSALANEHLGWAETEKEVPQATVIAIEVDKTTYDSADVESLTLLSFLASSKRLAKKVFVFHGDKECLLQAKESCWLFGDSFRTKYTIMLEGLDDEDEDLLDEDDDFETLLKSFTSDGNNTSRETDRRLEELKTMLLCEPVATERPEPTAEERLQRMVGLDSVKKDVADARIMSLYNKQRRILGLASSCENRNHMLFFGNPGTGKTTVAKLIGEMYHDMGLLSKGHTVEANRTKLVGNYIGDTEKNMRETLDKARGGVLFIDEAYNLAASADDSKDYGRQVLNALLTELSKPNPDMIIILAGYEDKMQALLQFNQGLFDRFPLKLHFADYDGEQLCQIATDMLREANYTLTPAAARRLSELTNEAASSRNAYFGNGRWVHNLVEQGIIKAMAKRVMAMRPMVDSKVLFSTIEECDVAEAARMFVHAKETEAMTPRRIGFTA